MVKKGIQRGLALLLAVSLCLTLIPGLAFADSSSVACGIEFSGGDGSEQSPYQISTPEQFIALAKGGTASSSAEQTDLYSKYYVLTKDIDLQNSAEVKPIGESGSYSISVYFTGGFDGQGNTISNYTLTQTDKYGTALFAGLKSTDGQNGYIRNLKLNSVNITGTKQVAALVGYNAGGLIENCVVTNAMIIGTQEVGGLVGKNYYNSNYLGKISGCGFEGSVQKAAAGSNSDFGGLVGYNNGKGTDDITIESSYAIANVTGGNYAGGLVGTAYAAKIVDSYSVGSVVGTTYAGGIAGKAQSSYSGSTIVKNVYHAGAVTATTPGGIFGEHRVEKGEISNLYFDSQLAADTAIMGENYSSSVLAPDATVTGKTSADLKALADTLNGTDGTVWRSAKNADENLGYPCLTVFDTGNTPELTPLAIPTGLAWNGTSATWQTTEHADSYLVQLYLGDSKIGSAVSVTGSLQYDFSEKLLAAGSGSYTFTVVAVGSGDYSNSAESEKSGAYAYTAPAPLDEPDGLVWEGATASWSAVAGAAGYKVQLYKDGNAQGAALDTLQTSYDFSSAIVESATYTFSVVAKGDGCNNTDSEAAQSGGYRFVAEDDFIAISTPDEIIELANIVSESDQREAWSKNYRLAADIVMTAKTTSKLMKPIGNGSVAFTGVFDGNGFTISNLGIDASKGGLFYSIGDSKNKNAEVRDLTLLNPAIESDGGSTGILARQNFGRIVDCAIVNGRLSSENGSNLGGMVYSNETGAVIERSYVSEGIISSNYANYASFIGGFAANNRGTISECYSTARVNAPGVNYAGGFIGWLYGGSISDCYVRGSVSGKANGAGFAGRMNSGTQIVNCYVSNNVTVAESGNPFIGEMQYGGGAITNCYYNSDRELPEVEEIPAGVTGKTTEELKALFIGSKWLTDAQGVVNGGLPYLKNLKQPVENTSGESITLHVMLADYDNETYQFSKNIGPVDVVVTENNPTVEDVLKAGEKEISYTAVYSKEYGYFVESMDGQALNAPDGWMYMINDELAQLGISSQTVKDGDYLLWYPGMPSNLFRGPSWSELLNGSGETGADSDQFEGKGTAAEPYLIKNAAHLAKVMDYPAAHFKVANDIDLTGVEFEPIGDAERPFMGNFDGGGFTLSNMTIDKGEDSQNVGLFGVLFDAKVTNVNIENASVTGGTQVGILAGYAKQGPDENGVDTACMIGNCHVSGSVTALSQISLSKNTSAGGLVGFNEGNNYKQGTQEPSYVYSAIDKCSADVVVTGVRSGAVSTGRIGGLVGFNSGIIKDSFACGNVAGSNTVGGLVGLNYEQIYGSYATGNASGEVTVGGFVGSSMGVVKNCLSTGNAVALFQYGENFGGFGGAVSGKTENCVSSGYVIGGTSKTGGLIGNFSGSLETAGGALTATLINCFGNAEQPTGKPIKGLGNYISGSSAAGDAAAAATGVTYVTANEKLQQLRQELGIEELMENSGQTDLLALENEAGKYRDTVNIPSEVAVDADVTSKVVRLRDGEKQNPNITVLYGQDVYGGYLAYNSSTGIYRLIQQNTSMEAISENITLTFVRNGEFFVKQVKVLIGEDDEPDEPDKPIAAQWPLWRGTPDNMAIVHSTTPRSTSEAMLKWRAKVMASGWTLSTPVIAGGYLFAASDDGLTKVDLETGEIVTRVPLATQMDWTPHLAYGDGMVFVPLQGGAVQAFDAGSLDSLWVSKKTGDAHQNLTPLTYQDGYLYTGTEGTATSPGSYFCLSTEDENPLSANEEKDFVWQYTPEDTGFYWAGAVISGDAVLFGSDGGVLTSLNRADGTLIDTFQADGAISSSVALAYGKAYFTTKSGTVYSIPVNADGTFYKDGIMSSIIHENAMESTSTPVVYGGRVYVGAKSKITVDSGLGYVVNQGLLGVLDAYTMTPIYAAELPANVQGSPLLTTAYQDGTQKIYLYVTYNAMPGGMQVIEDFSTNTEPIVRDLYVPESDGQNYCIASVIADDTGTLYYKNDSGYMFAIEKREAQGASVSFSVVPTNAKVTVKDANGAAVSSVSPGNYELEAGDYTYEVSLAGYVSKTGNLRITPEEIEQGVAQTVPVSLVKDNSGSSGKNITVYFTLLGDTVHDTPEEHTKSQTWINKLAVSVPADATAFDVFYKALTSKGFDYVEKSPNYISSISTPSSLGSITLEEMSNGPRSGWLYTVNEDYPMYGMREQDVKNGDKILFYYTDDYTLEPPSFEWNNKGNSNGNSSSSSTDAILSVGKGGTVSPSNLSSLIGKDVTFTITPNDGYRIKDVVVDGKSVGAVESYTYKNLKKTSRINVIFEEIAPVTPTPTPTPGETPEPQTGKFVDVPVGYWAEEYITYLTDKEIIQGITEDTFAPEEAITRAQFAAILARMSGEALPEPGDKFADVAADVWYAREVAWAESAGIVKGVSDTAFAPEEKISRQDMAVMLVRYAAYKGYELRKAVETRDFADADQIAEYAREAVEKMQQTGIISGRDGNVFAPEDSATRAESCKMLAVLLQAMEQ